MILMMMMLSLQEMMNISDILIEGVLITLEGHLGEVILLEEIFHFLEEIHPLVTISVGAMIPGDILDIHILAFQEGMEALLDLLDPLDLLVEIQEVEGDILSIFLILTQDQNHHHFSNSLV